MKPEGTFSDVLKRVGSLEGGTLDAVIEKLREGCLFQVLGLGKVRGESAPHGEVMRVMLDGGSKGAGCGDNIVGILKHSRANTAAKLREDYQLCLAHSLPVPETHVFDAENGSASFVLQPFVRGTMIANIDKWYYPFVMETLPQWRRKILHIMGVFEHTFPTEEQPKSRYPDPSGHREKGYVLRDWLNCLITPGETENLGRMRLLDFLAKVSPGLMLVDTGLAIHGSTQEIFTAQGIKTYERFGSYLDQIRRDKAYLQSLALGAQNNGKLFQPDSNSDHGYLNPTFRATFGIQMEYARHMMVNELGEIHIFRPAGRSLEAPDSYDRNYVGVISQRGSHQEKKMPEYFAQFPVEIDRTEQIPVGRARMLFALAHPGAPFGLGDFFQREYGFIPTGEVTHIVIKPDMRAFKEITR